MNLNITVYFNKIKLSFKVDDKKRSVEFINALLEDMEDNRFLPQFIFSGEAMFHVSGKVNVITCACGAPEAS